MNLCFRVFVVLFDFGCVILLIVLLIIFVFMVVHLFGWWFRLAVLLVVCLLEFVFCVVLLRILFGLNVW